MLLSRTCETFLQHCQQTRKLSAHTLTAYNKDLSHLLSYTGDISVHLIDKTTLKSYVAFLSKGELSNRSIKRRMACLSSMFRWLELDDVIQLNPFHKLSLNLKLPKQLPRNIPQEDLRKLIRTAQKNLGLSPKQKYKQTTLYQLINRPSQLNELTTLLAIELLFTTGIRVGELVKIELEHIHLQQGRIKIYGKGQRERYVFIADKEIDTLLKAYTRLRKLTHCAHSTLLVTSRGTAATPQFIRKLIRQLKQQARITRNITPHMYRHSAACQLLESGVDIRSVQKLLGHQSITTTELYTHIQDSALQDSVINAKTRNLLI